jgi:hypothetical protein
MLGISPWSAGSSQRARTIRGRDYQELRWSRFKNFAPAEMHKVVGEHVFPFLRSLGDEGSSYAQHMKDARFTIPTPRCWPRYVDLLDHVPMDDRDTKGRPVRIHARQDREQPGRTASSARRATSSS